MQKISMSTKTLKLRNFKWERWLSQHPLKLPSGERVWYEKAVRRVRYVPDGGEGMFWAFLHRLLHLVEYKYQESPFDVIKEE